MVRIRLRRMGAKKRPFYRVVVSDVRKARNGRFKESLGTYDPLTHPATIRVDAERALHWLGAGAQATDTAKYVLEEIGVWEQFMKSKGLEYKPREKKTRSVNLSDEAAVRMAAQEEAEARAKAIEETTGTSAVAPEPEPVAEAPAEPEEAAAEETPAEGAPAEEAPVEEEPKE